MRTRTAVCLLGVTFASGCRGGTLLPIAFLIGVVIAAAIRNGVSLSRRSCRHCGHAGATEHFNEKGFVEYVTCDHCGREP